MRKLITFFVNRPVWGNAFIAIVIIFGVFALSTTKKSFFPELDPNTIIVSVFYPGASPNEMEEGVTIKIEQAVKGIAAIDEINSTSSENFTSVKIKAFHKTNNHTNYFFLIKLIIWNKEMSHYCNSYRR